MAATEAYLGFEHAVGRVEAAMHTPDSDGATRARIRAIVKNEGVQFILSASHAELRLLAAMGMLLPQHQEAT